MIIPGPHHFDSEEAYLDALELALQRPLTYDEWEEARAKYAQAKYLEYVRERTPTPGHKSS